MTLTYDFTDRTAIVTGAAQGIGQAITELLASSGAQVLAFDRDPETLAAAWEGHASVRSFVGDVADATDAANAVDDTLGWTGRLDILVNNAGIARDGVVWRLASDDWNAVVAVHLTGTFNMTRSALAPMRAARDGRIVNVTSYTGLHGNVGQSNYAAAKAGIIGFTRTVAKETARTGITVNAISPNAMTAMVAAVPEDKLADLAALVPAGRFGHPGEMAHAVAFLASDEAGYITGAVLPVDGGMSI